MIGRHAHLQVYRELFRSEDFMKVFLGTLLIPAAFFFPKEQIVPVLNLGLADLALLLSIGINSLPIIIDAVKGLIHKEINVDELVSIAIIACVINGNYQEGAVVSAIMVVGALIEEAVSDSARNSIKKLVAVTPDTAIIEQNGQEVEVHVKSIQINDTVVARAGDTIAVDGTILAGSTSVDESSITGESMPVFKKPGELVFAGTMCSDGFIKVRADKVGNDSTIGRIVEIVQQAEQQKTRSGKIVDSYAAWFTPIILAAALLTYLLTRDITRAITVLIVGCPCSFLLASPVSTVAAIGRAAKAGIMVKGGKYLENIVAAQAFLFDKTGTLTNGEPEIVVLHPAENVSDVDLLAKAAAVEQGSLHPLAAAVMRKVEEMRLDVQEATDIHTEAGKGVSGLVNGIKIEVMTSQFLDDNGYTNVDVLVGGKQHGAISFADKPRATAKNTVRALANLGIAKIAIISGDQYSPVKKTAESVGIYEYYSSQKPLEKLEKIEALTKMGVVYLGDGINDAPALKAANTGIAMGRRGADLALETADIVLMNDRLEQLPFLVQLSRKMVGTIKTGIWLSLGINCLAVLAGAAGLLTPITGAITHNIGSILVVSLAAEMSFMREDKLLTVSSGQI